jgi:hypothetical protein
MFHNNLENGTYREPIVKYDDENYESEGTILLPSMKIVIHYK